MIKIIDTISLEIENVPMVVSFEYYKDSGYLYDSDGHGQPPIEDLEVNSVKIGGIEVSSLIFDTWIQDRIESSIKSNLE